MFMLIANINLIFFSSFQDTDFKQEMFTSLAREILAASQSEQVKIFFVKDSVTIRVSDTGKNITDPDLA